VHATKQRGLSTGYENLPDFNRVVGRVVDKLRPLRWRIPEDFLTYEHFYRVVMRLEWNSSPGYPYYLDAASKGQYLGVKNGIPDKGKVDALWGFVQQRLANRDSDPIRVFVKPEAHTKEKLDAGRYRLIYSVSLVDHLIDDMLFGDFNDKVVENYVYTPIKVGWSPLKGGWKQVPSYKVATDNSSHDQSRRLWQCDATLAVRTQLCENMTPLWKELATWRFEKLYVDVVIVTSGGSMFRQRNPGRQKSGSVLTLVDNSLDMLIVHASVADELGVPIPDLWAMGDDVLMDEEPSPAYQRCLRKHSIVKHIHHAGVCWVCLWSRECLRADLCK